MVDTAITIAELSIEEWAGWVVYLLEHLDVKANVRDKDYWVSSPAWLVDVNKAIATRLLDEIW